MWDPRVCPDVFLVVPFFVNVLPLSLPPQAAVINLDEPVAFQLMEQVRGFPVVTYGIDNAEADVVAESARFTIWESEVIVKTPLGKLQVGAPRLSGRGE